MAALIPTLLTAAGASAGTAATVGTIASVVGTVGTGLSAIGQIQAGRAARVSAKYQAAQMQQQAGQERATGQRQAIEQERRARLMTSRARAVAGASGAGVTDPTVANIIGDITTEGRYNAMSAIYGSEERAMGYETSAAGRVMEGKAAAKAGVIGGVATAAEGFAPLFGQSMYNKYSGLPWQQKGMPKPSYMGGGTY